MNETIRILDGRLSQGVAASALALALAALCMAAVGPAYLNHDAAWYLYMIERWFGGATLYRDVIDTNPPLIIWLSSPPVWLADATGWSATTLFKAYVFGLSVVVLLTSRRIVRAAWAGREFVLVGAAAFLVLPFAKGDFGQREHFSVLLTLPYVFAAASLEHLKSRRLRLIVGMAGGLGFLIKPHFLVAWIAVEIMTIARTGVTALRRTEFVSAAAAALTYVVVAAVATPEYLQIAAQVRAVYQGMDSSPAVLLRLREVQLWLAAAALFAAVRWDRDEQLPSTLFAAATGYVLAALLQFKGWGYHLYPARVFTLLFLVSAAAVIVERAPAVISLLRGGRRGLGVVFACVLLLASSRYVVEARRPVAPDLVTPMIAAIRTDGSDGPFAALSMRTIIYPAFPSVNYTGASWGLRHNGLWFLAGFYADQDRSRGGPLEPHAPEAMPPLEREFFEQIVDDLCREPPALLAFEEPAASAPGGRRALDLRAYYAQSPRVHRLLSGYEADGSVGSFALWRRRGMPACE